MISYRTFWCYNLNFDHAHLIFRPRERSYEQKVNELLACELDSYSDFFVTFFFPVMDYISLGECINMLAIDVAQIFYVSSVIVVHSCTRHAVVIHGVVLRRYYSMLLLFHLQIIV